MHDWRSEANSSISFSERKRQEFEGRVHAWKLPSQSSVLQLGHVTNRTCIHGALVEKYAGTRTKTVGHQ